MSDLPIALGFGIRTNEDVRLAQSYADGAIIGTSIVELEQAGIRSADLVVTATGDDSRNVFIAETASAVFGVGSVYARVEDESIGALLDDWNVEVLCPHRLCLNELARLEGLDESGARS